MPANPNKLSQFWQELKRRKVTRTITVYAAAAFVTLELVSIIVEPLKLPEWTLPFIIVLLCVGFIIAIILSWIYDIHPEGGMVKTELADKVKQAVEPKSSNSWKIASYISFVVIVGLIVLNIIPRTGKKEILDKSIAVLPFQNDSRSAENEHVINGYMASVHDNLCRIKDLKVLSLLSTEQYRNNLKPIPEIARELKVGYLLSARGQMYDKKIRLIVQLTDADENIIWSNPYDKQINEVDDHISIQSEIAQSVASVIEAAITPEEKQLIENIPTTNQTAYDFYQRGEEERRKYSSDDSLALERAENLYHYALEEDSTFALAYIGLANVYWSKHYWETYFEEDFLDSCLVLINIALFFDDQLDEAYFLKGRYYKVNGHFDETLYNYDKALKINPNYYSAYQYKGRIFWSLKSDIVKWIENYQKALSLIRGDERPNLLRILGRGYLDVGFIEKAKKNYQEALALDGNKALYLRYLSYIEFSLGNYEEAFKLSKQSYEIDSTRLQYLTLYNISIGHKDEAYILAQKYIEFYNTPSELALQSAVQHAHQIGYAFWQVGKYKEAETYFNQQIKYGEESIKLNRSIAQWGAAQYDLVCTYAFLGDTAKAYQYLDEFDKINTFGLFFIGYAKNNPFIKSIRNEERYQKTLQNIEAKYQAEHERVRQWLEENEML